MKRLIAIMATALVASSLLTAAAEARGGGGGLILPVVPGQAGIMSD